MRDNITLLASVEAPESTPWPPFDSRALNFLSDLSAEVLGAPDTRRLEAAAAFGFWCRRPRLEALARRHASPLPRLGRGLIFHLAPSNVPAMFAYTMALGLLAGNANIVRLSSRRAEEEAPLVAAIGRVLDRPEHAGVKARTALISYERDDTITAEFCARSDGRVVLGVDATVAALRAMPMPPHAVELCFPDRWSLALFSQRYFSALDDEARRTLAHRFYNDTYQMDQNACSSPQLVLWLADGGDPDCRRQWWEAVAAEAEERYPFGPFQAARKLERLCTAAMTMEAPAAAGVERYGGNLLYVVNLAGLTAPLPELKGGFGLFFQGELSSLKELPPLTAPKVQTLVCAGVEPREVAALLAGHGAQGVDRVVAPGQALELDTIWDGKDVIAALSRMIGGEV